MTAKYAIVPVEATKKMHKKCWDYFDNGRKPGKDWEPLNQGAYSAMLSARPPVPEEVVERVAKEIYLKMDRLNTDPWDEAMSRVGRYGIIAPPMIRDAILYARAAIKALEG
jgi:hypothetical protein